MFTLRPYQQEAVDKTIYHFQRTKDPAIIVLPTGAGKSIVIAELARLAKGRVLVLAHVKELVEQNFHKLSRLNLNLGIYSAGLKKKDTDAKIIFGSIQSITNAEDAFFEDFSIVIIDECHRVNMTNDTQYNQVINKLKNNNPEICILGLTATPYRLDQGWIYQIHDKGEVKTQKPCFFKKCIYELDIKYLIKNKYLTPAIKINSPVSGYDFSNLKLNNGRYSLSDIEKNLMEQKNITPIIIENIIQITEQYERQGVMIFTSSVKHANQINKLLSEHSSAVVTGNTVLKERDDIIERFKAKKIRYLINVSVLTTGFDAPHVDIIAILRPTESIGLYQQIIGRGLRLSPKKEDCLILDYTGQDHDIFNPIILDKKPNDKVEPVDVECPQCGHINEFWGIKFPDGTVEEHFGRSCHGYSEDQNGQIHFCNFLFRYKLCQSCGNQNDISARMCTSCEAPLFDPETALKEARSIKNAHVLKVEEMIMQKQVDKKFNEYLEIKYYDYDGNSLEERYYFGSDTSSKVFHYNFVRLHLKKPSQEILFHTPEEVISNKVHFKSPIYIIARKPKKFWTVTDKVFDYSY